MHSNIKHSPGFHFHSMKLLCERLVHFLILCILLFTLAAFFICLFTFCIKHTDVFSAAEIIWCIPVIAFFSIIFPIIKFMQDKSERLVISVMILVQSLIALIMIVSYNTQPCSDYAVIWHSANEIAQGTFSAGTNPAHYMYYYNWQLGITVLESFLIRLGFSFSSMKIFNAIMLIIIGYIEYYLVKKKLGYKTAYTAYILSTLFLPWCLSIPQFTNHHIGLIFLLLTLFLLDHQKSFYWFAAGIILAIMNVLRPLGIIVVLASICYSIYLVIQKRILYPFIPLFCLLFSYALFLSFFDQAFIQAGYTDAPVSIARLPYFKFQRGLYGYGNPSADLKKYAYDYDAYNIAMKSELIHHILSQPFDTLIFVAKKMIQYLGLFDYQFEMTYNHDVAFYTQYPVRALYSMSWFQYIGICLLALRGYLVYRKHYPLDIFQVFFIGNTLVYFLIEAFSSYRFENYPFLIMLAALGLEQPALHRMYPQK